MPFSKLYSISYGAFKFESPDGTGIQIKTHRLMFSNGAAFTVFDGAQKRGRTPAWINSLQTFVANLAHGLLLLSIPLDPVHYLLGFPTWVTTTTLARQSIAFGKSPWVRIDPGHIP